MAFKDGSGNIIITNQGQIQHSSYDNTTAPSGETKITASDGASGDNFGRSVAAGSGIIVIGAPYNDDAGPNSGSVYFYNLDGTSLRKITASDAATGDLFGRSVAIGSGRICVGAYGDDDKGVNSGSAYIYSLDGTQLSKITASDGAANDRFGRSVAIGSGRIVVGAYWDDDAGSRSGSAYIYSLEGTQLAKITANDGGSYDYFGWSVAVGSGRICVGAYGDDDNGGASGSAYIFDLEGTQLAKITANDAAASDSFGYSVAVGSGRIVVGSFNDDDKGSASGSAYIFDLDGTQLAKITASDGAANDLFGRAVAVGSGRIVIGAYGDDDAGTSSGSAYIFDLDGTQISKITASDSASLDVFGRSVAVGSGRICVGAYGDDDRGAVSGSAYIWQTPSTGSNYDSYIEYLVDD